MLQPPSAPESSSPDARSCEEPPSEVPGSAPGRPNARSRLATPRTRDGAWVPEPSPLETPLHPGRARWSLAPSMGRMSRTTRQHRHRGRRFGSAPRQARSRPLRPDRAAGPCDATGRAGDAQHLTRTWQGTIVCVATLRDPRARCTYPRRHRLPREITGTDTPRAIAGGLLGAGESGQSMGAPDHAVSSLTQIHQPRSPSPTAGDRRHRTGSPTRALSVLAPGDPPSRPSGTGHARRDDDSDSRHRWTRAAVQTATLGRGDNPWPPSVRSAVTGTLPGCVFRPPREKAPVAYGTRTNREQTDRTAALSTPDEADRRMLRRLVSHPLHEHARSTSVFVSPTSPRRAD